VVQEGVQVIANRKLFREFTSLRVVQSWKAHTGVIWTVAFSDTGAFMATGGKDRVIRVWENKRAPVEAGCARFLALCSCA
jgi:WD repeat-containing protein 44